MLSNVESDASEGMVSTIVDSPQSASVTLVDVLTDDDEVERVISRDAEIEVLEVQVEERRKRLLELVEHRIERECLMDVYKELANLFDEAMLELEKKKQSQIQQKALVDLLRKQLEEKVEKCEFLQSEVVRLEGRNGILEAENDRLNVLLR
ncbi:hypothetical protein BDP27DRAFT_1369724 [Rhodocollybia butyracea]|uniref:Uncharacterized protein n=1 Tax=Rhodocollybia butyracea TaxID=206335 RepID=A0A9P5PB18_9AGAR|nr:hypothetical protein BDP27DRAFT_1430494 [Rhodocollybia butyracea]KAF9061393.1 hypothetical protein BDP27DRAFT_1369724 [Rhodocollybia butyracea]